MKIENVNANVMFGADNMTFNGGQYGTVASDEGARQAARDLRDALQSAGGIDRATRAETQARAAEVEAALRVARPDKSRIAGVLKRLTELLAAAGSLAAAGAPLIAPLHALASWLGDLGAPILGLLPG